MPLPFRVGGGGGSCKPGMWRDVFFMELTSASSFGKGRVGVQGGEGPV